MLKYFIVCRKSSEDEDRQMLSIDAQLSELNSIAQENGLNAVNTFTESMSAKEPGRPIFNDMIRRIERGEANAILTWKLDRLARNFDDGGKIIGLLQRGVIQEIRTFERTYLPNDNVLSIAVEFGMANQYVRDLSMNIRRGIREKIRRGILSGKAPLGYFNEPKLRTIEPHPEHFNTVKGIFERSPLIARRAFVEHPAGAFADQDHFRRFEHGFIRIFIDHPKIISCPVPPHINAQPNRRAIAHGCAFENPT